MKPKKKAKSGLPPDAGTPSSRPEREDEDSEVVPPDAGAAEARQEEAEERAADDGMPEADARRPGAPR